jgi:hypothetical protein
MQRAPNPFGLVPVLVTAGLATVGLVGFGMGYRELTRGVPAPPPTNGGPAPEVDPVRPQLPNMGQVISQMHFGEPNLTCHRKGWWYGFSVTGVDDGAAFEYELHERPDGRWLVAYDYQHPEGRGHGIKSAANRDAAFAEVDTIQARVMQAYKAAQVAAGSPYVGQTSSTGIQGC